jgi:hypothetical protein
VGIRASADDVLEVNPLADSSISYFRADKILYHGHEIAVQWDATGAHYSKAGLIVEIDGKVVASSPTLARLRTPITRLDAPPISRKIAKSVQLQATTPYPIGNVSVPNASTADVHSAIDGRIFFFPESDVANGWNSPAGTGAEIWFAIDFGAQTAVSSAELAFFADAGQGFDAPASYRIQVAVNGVWTDVSSAKYAIAVANGITLASWKEISAPKIRLVFTPKKGLKVRVVEFKVF